mgnify:CR=1 FL=1
MEKSQSAGKTFYFVLFSIGFAHLLNDMIQSVVPAIYPILKDEYNLSFVQIGIITLVFQLTSSLLQPVVGWYADKHPRPYSLACGMVSTLIGLCLLSIANSFLFVLLSVAIIGCGSSVFHPEASRVAQMASGGRKSLAQSIFQVGGNGGSAFGPLVAALIVLPFGQSAIGWFSIIALLAILVLYRVGRWYSVRIREGLARRVQSASKSVLLPKSVVRKSLAILVILIFSKYFYIACMTNYFTFFLIEKFSVSIQHSQFYLFAFLGALAVGTVVGGILGDKYGRKYVILWSIFGAAPFTLLLPYVDLWLTIVLSILAGFIIASAFSAILVYATDLMPDKVGMIAGIFFGLMFGIGGLGSALFGWMADYTGIEFVFRVSTILPLIGGIAWFLPNLNGSKAC